MAAGQGVAGGEGGCRHGRAKWQAVRNSGPGVTVLLQQTAREQKPKQISVE